MVTIVTHRETEGQTQRETDKVINMGEIGDSPIQSEHNICTYVLWMVSQYDIFPDDNPFS